MKTIEKLSLAFLILIFCLSGNTLYGQEEDKSGKQEEKGIKKFEEVIPDTAKVIEGIFNIYQFDDKLYYEVKKKELDRKFLWLTQFAKTQTGFGYGGTEVIKRIVRWEEYQDHVLLRNVEHLLRAEDGTPEHFAVEASSLEAIIKSFKIEAYKDGNPVINVTSLFREDVPEFSPSDQLGASTLDKSRTFISSTKSFSKNIETKVLATYKLKPQNKNGENGAPRRSAPVDPSLSAATVKLHHSMVELPDDPMRPRYFDPRVGFFAGTHRNFSTDRHQVEEVQYIRRWRLEKKDPTKEVSEPEDPIVYYVGRGIPEKWKPYVLEGIEMWQPVFEEAGFKDAIRGKLAPGEEENPEFDAEDVRYSTIRWLPSTIPNAYGPHVGDPRTGEILEADIRIYHNVLSLIRDWYFVQASPSDPVAQDLPLPDSLVGKALRYVVAHEVGHTLGLRHNFRASASYPVEKYRDREFTEKYGLEASIMDYGRFNYIAQPGDDAATIPKIGPYDYFAIEWGYSQFEESESAKEDEKYLNKIAARQEDNPMLRFSKGREGGVKPASDPHARTEDLGDDPIKATEYGLKNIEHITGYLVEASVENNKDYELLNHMYDRLLGQMYRELRQVAALVGGIEMENRAIGESGEMFKPTPVSEQKEAIDFLLNNGFSVQDYLTRKDIVSRIGMHGIAEKLSEHQQQLLHSMLNKQTANRLLDLEATGYKTLPLHEMVRELRQGIFEELDSKNPEINIHRRNLQRAFVERLISFQEDEDLSNDLQAVARGNLMKLQKSLQAHIRKDGEGVVYYHIIDLNNMIEEALNVTE
jgi:hypothetical protein